jgi:hypothetical protein
MGKWSGESTDSNERWWSTQQEETPQQNGNDWWNKEKDSDASDR